MSNSALLWESLFEAAAQTLAGAVGSFAVSRVVGRFFQENTYAGAMDLWQRGIHGQVVGDGDSVRFDGLISPFSQLFPEDPLENGRRWNSLYSFPGKISSEEYQTLEFFAGSDAALRVGSLNGETVVGLYSRYGFIGEGLIGVVPTKVLLRALPDFFQPRFVGVRALVTGKLSRCPSQHAFIAQAIAQRAGLPLSASRYPNTLYLQVRSIRPFRKAHDTSVSLLGSVWAATESRSDQYLVQYGYITNPSERAACISNIQHAGNWSDARVYFDDIECPGGVDSFRRRYL